MALVSTKTKIAIALSNFSSTKNWELKKNYMIS